MFNNVNSFHESASETLYRDRSRGSELGPSLGCRHPVARNESPQAANTRAFVMLPGIDLLGIFHVKPARLSARSSYAACSNSAFTFPLRTARASAA